MFNSHCKDYISKPFFYEDDVTIGSRQTNGFVFVGKNVRVGRFSYINDGIVRPDTTIGRYCSIGRRVTIGAGDHRLERLSTHPVAVSSKRLDRHSGVVTGEPPKVRRGSHTCIGNDVWIGDGTVILAGVNVGDGAVIGANSVITKDVEPYAIVGGVPARLIRYRFYPEIVAALLECRWWELPHEAVLELPMQDVWESIQIAKKLRGEYQIEGIEYQIYE